jgi:hypothetical protein
MSDDALDAAHDASEAEVDIDVDDPVHTGLQGALPLDVSTGDARVDAAVGRLRALDGLDLADHPAVFTDAHRALQDALVDLDRDA